MSNFDRNAGGDNRKFRKVPGHEPVRVDLSDEGPAECSCGWTSHREDWVKHLIHLMAKETLRLPYAREQVALTRARLEKNPEDQMAQEFYQYALRREADAIARERDGQEPDEFQSHAGPPTG
jgi:hypothetical protein